MQPLPNGRQKIGDEPEFEFKAPESISMEDLLKDSSSGRNIASIHSGVSSSTSQVTNAVSKEAKELDDMASNTQEIDRLYQEQMDRSWSLGDRIMNRSMYREVQRVKSDLLRTSAQYRMNFYKTLLDARLAALSEKCEAGVKMIGAHYRKMVASFLMSKMEEMVVEIRDRQISFIEILKSKYAYADTLGGYPTTQKRYLDMIFEEEGRYLKFLDSLLLRFESIVDQQLQKY